MDGLEWEDVPMPGVSPGESWDIGTGLILTVGAAIVVALLLTLRQEMQRV